MVHVLFVGSDEKCAAQTYIRKSSVTMALPPVKVRNTADAPEPLSPTVQATNGRSTLRITKKKKGRI